MNEIILQVNEINKSFGSLVVSDHISFEVYRGETLGILGPNGAGKTTIIRMIMGIFSPDSGEIRFHFNGGGGPLLKEKIGYLPEERGLYQKVSLLDLLVYLAELKEMERKAAREAALYWLEKLGLKEWSHKKIDDLSKGMAQKVQFISSIIHSPQIVLFDEPFSGLDPVNQDFMMDIIEELKEGGMTILLSSHRMELVEELCDRIFLINKGKKVLYGPLEEIKDHYSGDIVHIKAREGLETLRENPYISHLRQEKDEAFFHLKDGVSPSIFLQELAHELDLLELKVEKTSLHQIFVNEVRKGDGG